MDKIYEKLDEAKAEIERLKAELRTKTDSLENLKQSHGAQANQIQEEKFRAERLEQELLQKEDEIVEAKQMCEDLKGNLNKKESIIKHLNVANDKLRGDCDEKLKKWKDEKRMLVLALEEANDKADNQEQQIHLFRQEIESLKGCLSVSKKKCLEIEKKLKASKELREKDDMLLKLEEEHRKVEDGLKWKKEQFKHLEEAHEKLRDQFRSSKKEWEMERSAMFDDISSLQDKLDSEIRKSDDLQHKLQSCHQALSHVESQKKRLELEVSDFKLRLGNFSGDYQDPRLQLDYLNSKHDKDIGDLSYSMKLKESKYIIEKLEQENQELRTPFKELQEARIQESGASYSSQSKLRPKVRKLEQVHKECASTLKHKEAEWKVQVEQLTGKLRSCESELETKTAAVEKLKMELERSHSSTIEMELLNEEMSVMLLVLKQGISEVHLKLADEKDKMDLMNKEREEKVIQLMKQLEMKDAPLMNQVELQNELDRYKEMLEESNMCQLVLKEQLKEVHDALDSANVELDESLCERSEMEFELQMWMSVVERLKNDLEESLVMRKELETSLLAQVDVGESLRQEKNSLAYKLEEKERSIDNMHRHVVLMEQELKS